MKNLWVSEALFNFLVNREIVSEFGKASNGRLFASNKWEYTSSTNLCTIPRLQVGYSAKMNLLLFAMIFDLKIRAQGGFKKKKWATSVQYE